MVKELFYRRSFHCDRDLKGIPDMLELEQPKRRNATARLATSGGGFEAPRNSLDVPMGGAVEKRRHSEARSEDVPVGYELRRSLTTTTRRRQYEDFLDRRTLTASANPILLSQPAEWKTHVQPSVVARLMGLDPLPASQEHLQCSPHPSSRRLPHKFFTSGTLESNCVLSKPAIISPASSQRGDKIPESDARKLINYGELPYMNHPQEKQLQDFKKEFTARLLHQDKQANTVSLSTSLNQHASQEKQSMRGVALQESQEFLDALDFLHSNKEFFTRVLKDPSPLFGRSVQVPAFSKLERDQREKKRSRSFSESRKDSYSSHRLNNLTVKHGSCHVEADDRMVSPFRRYGRDEEMPVHLRQHTPALRSHQTLPTKIVVLRPKLEKLPSNKPTSDHLSPIPLVNGPLKGTLEGGDGFQYDTSARLHPRHGSAADGADIARQIAKQVKQDSRRQLLNTRASEPASIAEKGRSPARRFRDGGGGASDGEGYYSTMKRPSRQNAKVLTSLSRSPRLSRSDAEDDRRHVGLNGQKSTLVEQSTTMATIPVNITRDSARDKVIMNCFEGSTTKQDGVRDFKPLRRSHSINEKDGPKALSRSLSASAAESRSQACIGGGRPMIAAGTNSGRVVENSPFKARLLSLKYSFSSGKKKDEREYTSSLVPTVLSIPPPRVSNGETKEPCHGFTDYKWQAMEPAPAVLHIETRTGCPEDNISLNSLTSSGRHQWSSSSTSDLMDSASDISTDKCEQPSPISVLEMPFQDDSLSSLDRIVTPACQGTCLQKHPFPGNGCGVSSSSTLLHSSFNFSVEGCFRCGYVDSLLESFETRGIACPPGLEEELIYIRDLLAFAGFTSNKVSDTHAFSVQHGINPSIFERLESYYEKLKKGSHSCVVPLDSSHRKLLFDIVDEILSKNLSGPTTSRILNPDKQLLVQIWDDLSHHRFVPCDTDEESLDVLASKDLMKGRTWVASENEMEAVMVGLERMICGDLIREVVYERLRR